jgi:predicted PurR-regulated permease PerM
MKASATPVPRLPEPAPRRLSLTQWALRALIFSASLVALYAFAKAAWIVLNALLLGFSAVVMGIGLRGAGRFIAQKTGWPTRAGVALVGLLMLGVPVGAGLAMAPKVVNQWEQAKGALPEIRDRFDQWVSRITDEFGSVTGTEQATSTMPTATEQMTQTIKSTPSSSMMSWLGKFVGGVGQAVGGALFILVVGLYLALSPEPYFEGALKLVPCDKRDRVREVMLELSDKLEGWIIGQIVAMVVVGVLSTVGLMILGVPAALLLGVLAGLMDLIPNFGPLIAGLPAVLVAAGQGKAVHVFVLYSAIQLFEGWVMRPFIERKAADTPPALLLFGQVLAASLVGFMGLLTVPALLVAGHVLISRLYVEDMLGDRAEEAEG